MLLDYNLLLAGGIWLFYLGSLLLPVAAGQGVAYLAGNTVRLDFPSWRATFLGRRVALLHPWRSLRPMLLVDMLAPSAGSLAQPLARLRRLEHSQFAVRSLLLLVLLYLLLAIPASLLLRLSGSRLLLLLALTYGLQILVVLALWLGTDRAFVQTVRSRWKLVFEPFLCLPYAGQLLRKLHLGMYAPVPLADLLRAKVHFPPEVLEALDRQLVELLEIHDAPDEIAQLNRLRAQIASLQAKEDKA